MSRSDKMRGRVLTSPSGSRVNTASFCLYPKTKRVSIDCLQSAHFSCAKQWRYSLHHVHVAPSLRGGDTPTAAVFSSRPKSYPPIFAISQHDTTQAQYYPHSLPHALLSFHHTHQEQRYSQQTIPSNTRYAYHVHQHRHCGAVVACDGATHRGCTGTSCQPTGYDHHHHRCSPVAYH